MGASQGQTEISRRPDPASTTGLPTTASPLCGDLTSLPPVRVHVGDEEVLLDDSRRYVERAVAAGVDAKLDVWMNAAWVRHECRKIQRRYGGTERNRSISN